MSDRPNAVISGSLAEIKFVKSRSVCVLCIEIPIEQSEDAIAKFGVPLPGREIPLALALIQTPPGPAPAADSGPSTASGPPITGAVPGRDAARERGRERYLMADDGERAVTRAALLCRDPAFWRWQEGILQFAHGRIGDAETSADFMRRMLSINSRRNIATDEWAYDQFRDLEFGFHGHAELRS